MSKRKPLFTSSKSGIFSGDLIPPLEPILRLWPKSALHQTRKLAIELPLEMADRVWGFAYGELLEFGIRKGLFCTSIL